MSLGEQVLWHSFVWTLLFIHVIFTYMVLKHHHFYIKSHSLQLNCQIKALEKETLRYKLKQEYLDKPLGQINVYNFWRTWIFTFPFVIILAIFMFIREPQIDPVLYYGFMIIGTICCIFETRYLMKQFGYPPIFNLSGTTTGDLQRFLSYYTQPYTTIEQTLQEKLSMCYDAEEQEVTCWNLIPSQLQKDLLQRYVSENPTSNKYQAMDYFEDALRKKDFSKMIGYMKLSSKYEDLDIIGLTEHPYRDMESSELVDFMSKMYKSALGIIIIPWIMIIYLVIFHVSYRNYVR